ncbi:MAG: lipopolysaccharide biosynthesis protein [Caldilinea sp. CFX5]|nr:lipopolysaccharide biosynthesis protein [Caldilinea sp. CFX5]
MVRLVLLRLLESYFRHRWLYLLPIVAMSAAALIYIAAMPATYVVNGTLYIQNDNLLSSLTDIRNDGFSYVTPAQATTGELYQLLNAKAFLRAIIQKTDMEAKMAQDEETAARTIDEAKEAIWLQELGNNLVMVAAQHEMPRVAQQLAAATIETYIQWKINLNREESVAAQNFFADLIKTYRTEVEPAREALDSYLKAHPKPLQGDRPEEESAEIKRLQAALDTAEERLRRAENQEESARLALAQAESTVRQSYFVVDAPERPLAPERSKQEMLLILILFVAAGFGLSFVGIVGGALLDDSLRFPIDVVHGLHLPVLTMIRHTPVEVTQAYHDRHPLVRSNQALNASFSELQSPVAEVELYPLDQNVAVVQQPFAPASKVAVPSFKKDRKRNPLFR